MNASIPLLFICFDKTEAQTLTELAKNVGYPDAPIVFGPTPNIVKTLDNYPSSPQTIVIDIGASMRDILPEIDEIALHCEPNVNVMVIGSVNDISFYRELKQRGIQEYFPRPAQAGDIRIAIKHASSSKQQSTPGSSVHGTVIACMSAASGDGGSTLAVNLAHCLAETHKQSVVLVDMDYQFGLIAKSLDLTAPFGIRELFDHPERGLDNVLVEKMLVKYGENLRIVASPNELHPLPHVKPDLIRDLIDILRSKFKFVIIDIPHIWTPWTAAVLKNADHTMFVGQLWLRSLTHATRLLLAWQNLNINRENVSLIINRSGAKFKEAISADEFERICRQKIEAHLNNDIKALVTAENQGRTLYETLPEGALLQQQIKQIALTVMQRFNIAPLASDAPSASTKKGLKGLFDKKAGL